MSKQRHAGFESLILLVVAVELFIKKKIIRICHGFKITTAKRIEKMNGSKLLGSLVRFKLD